MLIKILLFIFISINIYASNTLDSTYYVKSKDIKLSVIAKATSNDSILFTINKNKHSLKLRTKDLIKILSENGYSDYTSKSRYTSFILKSPVDTSRIELAIQEYYQKHYFYINISGVHVEPRSYMYDMPDEYVVNIKKKNYLKNRGTIDIKTPKNKKIFFNYTIKATIDVYTSKESVKKDTELSLRNVSKVNMVFEKFRAKPIEHIGSSKLQTKHHLSKGSILTSRDVVSLSLVRKNSTIQVGLNRDSIDITFSAKALQKGKLNDIIKVQKSNGKILKVIVTGKNKAEMR